MGKHCQKRILGLQDKLLLGSVAITIMEFGALLMLLKEIEFLAVIFFILITAWGGGTIVFMLMRTRWSGSGRSLIDTKRDDGKV